MSRLEAEAMLRSRMVNVTRSTAGNLYKSRHHALGANAVWIIYVLLLVLVASLLITKRIKGQDR